jgi:hypothetical protein
MRFSYRSVWSLVALLAFSALVAPRASAQSSALSVVPGAVGFGTDTRAAYGGSAPPTVFRVTNLNDSGSGSFRAALEAPVPRVVIFEISGTITLSDDLYIRDPYVTVAGQTAPSPGITVRGAGVVILTHDILLQHFRIRPGGDTCNSELQAWGTDIYNVVIDHMSTSWGQDEGMVFYNPTRPINVTVWRSLVAEGLFTKRSASDGCGGGTGGGPHGILVYASTQNVFVGQSIMSTNQERNPYMQNGTRTVLVNNLVYNWLSVWGFTWTNHTELSGAQWYASVVGNRFVGGPFTNLDGNPGYMFTFLSLYDQPGDQLYRADNTFATNGSQTGSLVAQSSALSYDPSVQSPPSQAPLPVGFTPLASTAVEAFVKANAGARPVDRDSVDTRVIQNITNRTVTGGWYPTSQNDVGGWPTLAVNRRPLALPANPNAVTASRYTALEEWLHGYASQVEGGAVVTSLLTPTGFRIAY